MGLSKAKQTYKAFIKDHFVPIFFQDYFLNVVCQGQWDVVLSKENNKVAGAYIYMLKQKLFLKYIVQPQLCPYTGPIFFEKSNVNKVYTDLLVQLPSHHLLIQDYLPTLPHLKGFTNTAFTKHTYLLDKTTDLDKLWQEQSSTHRRIIRKAERELLYEEVQDINSFLDFVSTTFAKRNKSVPNDPEIFRNLDQVLFSKGQRKIVKCTNSNNEVVAMCYFMKDKNWTYNFANGVVDDYRHYGMNLILWNEIKASFFEGRSFDFEGSMIPGVDEFFKRFKGKRVPYQTRNISKNKLVDVLVKIKRTKQGT
ncbi:MAG: hypothetical protein P1U56_01080 [Saprospiraceae bacterium]|nr:hypothetical protein [Saprospiraceae bacterium]